MTEAEITPWYRAQLAGDHARVAQIEALRAGRVPEPGSDPMSRRVTALFGAMLSDAELYRAAMEYIGTVSPIQDILRRPDVATAIDRGGGVQPPAVPGPSREALLDLVR